MNLRFQYPQADRRGCNGGSVDVGVPQVVFQYPQADRRGCNPSIPTPQPSGEIVSVSTSGSKGVQHCPPPSRQVWSRRFSIHKRIEGGATIPSPYLEWLTKRFSIHKRIEGGATHTQQRFRLPVVCFSIHKRIEGGATSPVFLPPKVGA